MASPESAPAPATVTASQAFTDAPVPLAWLSRSLDVISANTAWRSIVERAPTVTDSWTDMFDPITRGRLTDALQGLSDGASVLLVEARSVDDVAHFELWVKATQAAEREAPSLVAALIDVSARQAREAALAFDATHDDLTGLLTRAALFPAIEQALARQRRNAGHLALLLIELDHVEHVSDPQGSSVHDDVLRTIGRRLRLGARTADTVARTGDTQFAVVCEGLVRRDDADPVAARLLDEMRRAYEGSAIEARITATVGIAHASADSTPRSLLDEAELAMHDAPRPPASASARPAPARDEAGGGVVDRAVAHLRTVGRDADSQWALALAAARGDQASRWASVAKHVRAAVNALRDPARI